MGLFNLFNKRKIFSEEEFNSPQNQKYSLGYALAKFNECHQDSDKTRQVLKSSTDFMFTLNQVEDLIEKLEFLKKSDGKDKVFETLADKCRSLIDSENDKQAYDLAYSTYSENPDNIQLTEIIYQIAERIFPQNQVVSVFDELIQINPDEEYNINYKKGLFLKSKNRLPESMAIFIELTNRREFAWDFYQIAIIENLSGNTEKSLEYLRKTFQIDPRLKEDAQSFPEWDNLRNNVKFTVLIKE